MVGFAALGELLDEKIDARYTYTIYIHTHTHYIYVYIYIHIHIVYIYLYMYLKKIVYSCILASNTRTGSVPGAYGKLNMKTLTCSLTQALFAIFEYVSIYSHVCFLRFPIYMFLFS